MNSINYQNWWRYKKPKKFGYKYINSNIYVLNFTFDSNITFELMYLDTNTLIQRSKVLVIKYFITKLQLKPEGFLLRIMDWHKKKSHGTLFLYMTTATKVFD